ncbi:MAG: hypothetical protein U0528_12090 [Anaerolineae bacterium]|nr:hypothetical protein [Anaerolineae bacterium]
MREIFPAIYEVMPSKQTPKKYRTFFVQHPEGNLLFPCFSASSTIDANFSAIDGLGGIKRQLLGDSHFKAAHCDEIAKRFDAPLYCSEVEAPDVTATLQHVVTFPFTRHFLAAKVEVIPTPGHRDGGVCYLVSAAGQRYLFAGDFIWHDGEQWISTARKATVSTYIASLRLVESLDFDVLLVNSVISNPTCFIELNKESRSTFIAKLVSQLDQR